MLLIIDSYRAEQRGILLRKLLVSLLLLSLVSLSVLPSVPGAPRALRGTMAARQPSPPGGVLANWTTNRVQNPGFENWSTPGDAADWSEERSADSGTWYATTPDPVQDGTYSAGMQTESPSGGGFSFTYFEQNWLYANLGLLNLSFDWYSDQTQNIGSDEFVVDAIINNSGSTHTMRYYLNWTSPPSLWNTSHTAYFTLGGPTQQWNYFSRNLTADFESVAEFPSLSTAAVLMHFRFVLTSAADTTQVNRGFIDNVVLENDTTVWIKDATNNGNFEAVANWNLGRGYEEGFISRSTTVHSGSYSANLTAACNQRTSKAELSYSPYTRITALNPANLSFWWYLDVQDPPSFSLAYLRITCYNNTGYQYIHYHLGSRSTMFNQTNSLVLQVDNFNTTNSWFHVNRNLWEDAHDYFNTDELTLYTLHFGVTGGGDFEESRITLLIDDVEHLSGAVNGAGFEDQPAEGSDLRGWGYTPSTDDRLKVTSTAYAGDKAAHLYVNSSSVFGKYQTLCGRPIRGSRNTYLDVVWRLKAYTPRKGSFICFYVKFSDDKYLYYYFAASSEDVKHNGTLSGYFNVTGINTGQTWHSMHRCLSSDYEAVFGYRPNTTLDTFHLYANATGGSWVGIIFDDLYIYDTEGPINLLMLLFPVIVAAIVIIIVVIVVLFVFLVWRPRRKSSP